MNLLFKQIVCLVFCLSAAVAAPIGETSIELTGSVAGRGAIDWETKSSLALSILPYVAYPHFDPFGQLEASAVAEFGNVELYTRVSNDKDGGASAALQSRFIDTFQVNAPPETTVVIEFILDLTARVHSSFCAAAPPILPAAAGVILASPYDSIAFNACVGGGGHKRIKTPVAFAGGTEFPLGVSLLGFAYTAINKESNAYVDARATGHLFINVLTLGVSITSASGATYSEVPEPSIGVFGFGVISLLLLLWRRVSAGA